VSCQGTVKLRSHTTATNNRNFRSSISTYLSTHQLQEFVRTLLHWQETVIEPSLKTHSQNLGTVLFHFRNKKPLLEITSHSTITPVVGSSGEL
jgi:hypothetical protein